ncbi:MAG: acyltransferase [Solirubrobacterales bacterium]|nr:acyltransferase [Solirubrobacterales bacterium]
MARETGPVQGRFIAGDPLRGLSSTSVIVFHVCAFSTVFTGLWGDTILGDVNRWPIRVLGALDNSLWVFLALSGYLIARPFVSAFLNGTPLPSLPPYLRNRLLRILPALALASVVTLVLFGAEGASPKQVLAVPTLTQLYFPSLFSEKIVQAWTVDDEALFYLAVPLLCWLLVRLGGKRGTREGRVAVVIAGAAIVFAASVAMRSGMNPDSNAIRLFPRIAFAFCPGIILAALSCVLPERLWGRTNGRWIERIMLLGAAATFLLSANYLLDGAPVTRAILGGLFAGFLIGGPLLRQWCDGTCSRLFDNALLHWVGVRSYSIYLLHVAIGHKALGWLGTPDTVLPLLGDSVLVIGASYVLGGISYRFVEQPFLRLRKGWRRQPAVAEAAAGPATAPGAAALEPAPVEGAV